MRWIYIRILHTRIAWRAFLIIIDENSIYPLVQVKTFEIIFDFSLYFIPHVYYTEIILDSEYILDLDP